MAENANPLNKRIKYDPENIYFLRQDDFNTLFGNDSSLETIQVIIEDIEYTYVKLNYNYILKLFLYCNPNQYYVRDTEKKIPFE